MAAQLVQLTTFKMDAMTDGNGYFQVAHGLEVYQPDGFRIRGVNIAIQHRNGNWHTIDVSNVLDNRFRWNRTYVLGQIISPDFANRPVRIIIFAELIPG